MEYRFTCPECGLRDGLFMESFTVTRRFRIKKVTEEGRFRVSGEEDPFIFDDPPTRYICAHCGYVVCETDDTKEAFGLLAEHLKP